VHRRRAQANHVCAVLLDAAHADLQHLREHGFLLAVHQRVEVGRDIERAHRGAVLREAVFGQRLFVAHQRRRPLREDRELRAQRESEQHRGLARRHHRDVEHRAQRRHARVAHRVDAHRIEAFGLSLGAGFEDREIHQRPVVRAHERGRTGLHRAEMELALRVEPHGLELGLAPRDPGFIESEWNDDEDLRHG